MKNKKFPRIKVFVTKNNKFRARIQEKENEPPYEVTIGGLSWQNGVGRKYENRIVTKCLIRLMDLNSNLKESLKK